MPIPLSQLRSGPIPQQTTSLASSPRIDGTPTGTGIATVVLKQGDGSTTYSTTSTSLTDVDATNLVHDIVVPAGWTLIVDARGSITVSTGVSSVYAAVCDGGTTLNAVVDTPSAVGLRAPFAVTGTVNGDGQVHSIRMRYRTSDAANAVSIFNSAGNDAVPTMLLILIPAN